MPPSEVLSPPRAFKSVTVIDAGPAAPVGVLAWLPFLWSHVGFPGASSAVEPLAWRRLFGLALFSGLLLYPWMTFDLFEPDEGRYAQIPREMLTAGEWIVPTLQGEPYLDKPPLFYWLVMLSYAAFGAGVAAARLVPAFAIHASLLVTYGLGRRLVGERAAWWGALLLTVSPLFFGMGRLLVLDGLLTLWVTLALLSALLAQQGSTLRRGWWLLSAAACGLGVLTKGPVAPVLLLVPVLTERWLHGRRAPIRRRDWLAYASIVASLALPWYVAVVCRLSAFARHFLWEHNVMRFVQPFDHDRPVWFYAPILLVGLLPLTLLAPWWGRFLLSGGGAPKRCPATGALLLAGGWCVFFFSLAGCKLPTYVLPAFAPLCLAAGAFMARRFDNSRWVYGIVAAIWLGMLVSHAAFIPRYAESISPMHDAETVAALCAGPSTPVVCFPRNVDSVAFALDRADFRTFRSKQVGALLEALDQEPRTVVLFGHHNSLGTLQARLPSHLRLTDVHRLGQCEVGVVERLR